MDDAQNTAILPDHACGSGPLNVCLSSSRLISNILSLACTSNTAHFSFIISEFGGVTITTQGFEHVKKVFYLALDILAHGGGECGDSGMKVVHAYVQQSRFALNSQRAESGRC